MGVEFWAKTTQDDQTGVAWHPLVLHLVDVSVVADAVLSREPAQTRDRTAAILGLPCAEARPWLLLLIACHDLGKACPGFQCKWEGASELLSRSGLRMPAGVTTKVNHAFVSQVVLAEFLTALQWPAELASLAADAVGCHHGERAAPASCMTWMATARSWATAIGRLRGLIYSMRCGNSSIPRQSRERKNSPGRTSCC